MTKEFEMSDDDLKELLEASKPTPVMYISGGIPIGGTPQANANYAWQKLGEKLGFDWTSAAPVSGKGDRFFTAEPLIKVQP